MNSPRDGGAREEDAVSSRPVLGVLSQYHSNSRWKVGIEKKQQEPTANVSISFELQDEIEVTDENDEKGENGRPFLTAFSLVKTAIPSKTTLKRAQHYRRTSLTINEKDFLEALSSNMPPLLEVAESSCSSVSSEASHVYCHDDEDDDNNDRVDDNSNDDDDNECHKQAHLDSIAPAAVKCETNESVVSSSKAQHPQTAPTTEAKTLQENKVTLLKQKRDLLRKSILERQMILTDKEFAFLSMLVNAENVQPQAIDNTLNVLHRDSLYCNPQQKSFHTMATKIVATRLIRSQPKDSRIVLEDAHSSGSFWSDTSSDEDGSVSRCSDATLNHTWSHNSTFEGRVESASSPENKPPEEDVIIEPELMSCYHRSDDEGGLVDDNLEHVDIKSKFRQEIWRSLQSSMSLDNVDSLEAPTSTALQTQTLSTTELSCCASATTDGSQDYSQAFDDMDDDDDVDEDQDGNTALRFAYYFSNLLLNPLGSPSPSSPDQQQDEELLHHYHHDHHRHHHRRHHHHCHHQQQPHAGQHLDPKDRMITFAILGTSVDDESAKPHVLSPPLMDSLRPHMPYALQDDNFWLKYSLVRDGASLMTLLSSVRSSAKTVLAIETVNGEVFGAFTSSPWRLNGSQFYGSCEAFLWRMRKPRSTECRTVLDRVKLESDIDTYSWTGSNRNIQLSNTKTIVLGGGGSEQNSHSSCDHTVDDDMYSTTTSSKSGDCYKFGISINGDLSTGTTEYCATFGNPKLTVEEGEHFEIANLEVWTITPVSNVAQAEKLELSRQFVFDHGNVVQ
eukprot:CAMPEP_0198296620 /NCGR_PEP_ID=MMETSP1449-20131203/33256_1 /TAXON_ID=420275 /ORGANISM="Attheya septentrionalis, Strain CCMP2084" /LENGTH=786 /DNA_ID=CAMNT_0043997285 /DNA_START=269 /DNA_END=2629 /DNA_ORIENTATION=+